MSHDHTQMSKDFYVGKILQGNYLVERLVGKGGMAWVYKTEHVKFKEPMAVKILLPHIADEPEIRKRFLEEARIQFKLKHANIVQVTDVIEDGPMIAIVMEWVGGENLKQLLRKLERPISRKDIWRIMGPILDAIGYAHRQGLVHRDIKPANILLHTENDRLVPKIADFGIAKVLDEAMEGRTATGITMGTLKFMPPEQIRDSKRVDHRADVYALGATLYVMATRRLPFLGKGDWVIYQQLNEDPPPPSSFNPAMSDAFDQVVLRCMDKNPDNRYQSCAELAQALSLALLDPNNIKRLSTQELNAIDIYNLLVSMPEESSVYSSSVELMSPAAVTPMAPQSQTSGGTGNTEQFAAGNGEPAPAQGPYTQASRVPTHTMNAFKDGDDTGNTGNTGNTSPTNQAHAPTAPGAPHIPPEMMHQAVPAPEAPLPDATLHQSPPSYTSLDAYDSQTGLSQIGGNANNLVLKTAILTILAMVGVLALGTWLLRSGQNNSTNVVRKQDAGKFKAPPPLIREQGPCKNGATKPCYDGPPGTQGKGICKAGISTCQKGKWSPCVNQIKPHDVELCNNKDDNCNGQIDETFAEKGKPCKGRSGDCATNGVKACRKNGKGLYCRSSGRAATGKGRVILQISPRKRFRIRYRGRSRRVRGSYCLSLKGRTRVTILHGSYYKCVVTIPASKRRMRIRMKRKNPNDLDPSVNYCKR